MKRFVVVAAVTGVTLMPVPALGFPTPGPGDPPPLVAAASIPPGIYTYGELRSMGYDPDPGLTPEEVGLPVCKPDPTWPGLREDSPPAPDAPTGCVADVTKFEFAVGFPPPHAGYHWNGYRTNARSYAGGKVEIEVRDPSVDHDLPSGTEEFVANRVLTQTSTTSDWLEVGWAEVSWKDNNQYVYSYDTEEGTWGFPGGYNLTTGSYYAFRTRNCTVNNDDRQCGELFWSGQWQLIRNSDPGDCRKPDGAAMCAVEEFTEVFSEDTNTPHPNLTGTSGGNVIDWRNTELRTDAGSWVTWTAPSEKGTQTAYDTCPIKAYYRFYAIKGSC